MARPSAPWWNEERQAWCSVVNGRRHTLAKGKGNKQAARKRLNELLKEQELLSKVNGVISVAGLCERFLIDANERLAPKTFESYQWCCQKLVDELGVRAAHSIRPEDISSFKRVIHKTLEDSSVAIVLRSIQRCFNWGVEERIIPPHELGRIRKPRTRRREKLVTDAEFKLLMHAARSSRKDGIGASFRMLLMAMEWTGCRPGELAGMTWSDVHFEQDLAILWKHKTQRTGQPKVVPLIPKLRRLLLWLQKRSASPHVFVNSRGERWNRHSIAKRMVHAREKAGLGSDVVAYSLRHRVATNVLIKTGDLYMTSALMGHSSVKTTTGYLHMANDEMKKFSNRALG